MIEHHIQKTIIYKLALSEGMRFSEIKSDNLENKLFDYHLKKTISSGLVEKGEDNIYRLTGKGKLLGLRALEKGDKIIYSAESVLFLVIQKEDSWLLYKRKTHPLKNQIGFMHVSPLPTEGIEETASKICFEKTKLKCTFKSLGGGYFRVFRQNELESFTHFTLLFATDVSGEVKQNDELADYFWIDKPDFTSNDMLPNMQILSKYYLANKPFFIEESFYLDS